MLVFFFLNLFQVKKTKTENNSSMKQRGSRGRGHRTSKWGGTDIYKYTKKPPQFNSVPRSYI